VFIPWGSGFIYYGIYDMAKGYKYALVSTGIALIIWGIRKGTVNRIKLKVEAERLAARRVAREARKARDEEKKKAVENVGVGS